MPSENSDELFALVDCNNFFASCEQVFTPKLMGKPLVILSNNDGCIIARSAEAKALGIKMGEPLFKCRDFLKEKKVHVLSSNFTLYGDLSERVMTTLEGFGYPIQIYSIDEAFIHLPRLPDLELETLGKSMREKVRDWIGIPIAIGIAQTKTLAKVANKMAKKQKGTFILLGDNIDATLAQFPVEDIWGVGRSSTEKLHAHGIRFAKQLKDCDDRFLRSEFTVQMLRTVWELRGNNCFEEEEGPDFPKSITSSRSFGKKIFELTELKEAVASFTAKASHRLREQNACAGRISVFVCTDHLHSNSGSLKLPVATSYTPELIHYANAITSHLFRQGLKYRKAGIVLDEIIPENELQLDLFTTSNLKKREAAMQIMDEINSRYERNTLRFAAEGFEQSWKGASARRTPRFTTCWDELPVVR